jgi:hypothetical protein
MNVKIVTNDLESGDWVMVIKDGEEIYSGHNIGTLHMIDILKEVNGFEDISYHALTDEELENWEEVVYK